MDSISLPVQVPEPKPDTRKAFRNSSRHARSSTRVLKEWFAAHLPYPYPSDHEKKELKEQTGLSIRQISYWFTNARRRSGISQKPQVPTEPTLSMPLSGAESFNNQGQEWSGMVPLDRWKNSPPEEEPAALDAIAISLGEVGADSSLSLNFDPFYDWTSPANWSFDMAVSHGPASYFGSSDQSHSSNSSVHSYSPDSHLRVSNQEGRRRRRRNKKPRNPSSATEDDKEKRIYQCTFCTDTFKSRYDWTRHESTLHLSLEKWTCVPSGPRYCDPSEELIRCAFCGDQNPSDQHIQEHSYEDCATKPLHARVFYRKDHLRQHLRLSHKVNKVLPSMNEWKSKIYKVKSRCGFCGKTFSLWADRNDHLADHYRAGALTKDWKGCRGLEPAVALLVQNAMSPYLIGAEANDRTPFSASRAASQRCKNPSQFESPTARLGDYVRTEIGDGKYVPNDLVQRDTRLALCGENGPWDQTPSGSSKVLRRFNTGHGLIPNIQPIVSRTRDFDTIKWDLDATITQFPDINTTAEALLRLGNVQYPISSANLDTSAELGGGTSNETSENDNALPWTWHTAERLAELKQMKYVPPTDITDLDVNWDFEDHFIEGFMYPELLFGHNETLDVGTQ
ncbi:homeobox and c2h2 transcription [Colletotrichum truncatum]|uniref:Homeobox and c2h2 transcription n=1 Tax=Colletotrichum truncatum TaxID=5467 RepID=A0ACC3YSE4_COLTU|nr:homeobox and C2H2 transcription protein [Colletotrichum truncatum]KAF6799095.1 homeobox and C2H2 transcription protein [Colletotrichum truncatum]